MENVFSSGSLAKCDFTKGQGRTLKVTGTESNSQIRRNMNRIIRCHWGRKSFRFNLRREDLRTFVFFALHSVQYSTYTEQNEVER